MDEKIALKLDRYRRFLKYEETDRPIIGLNTDGWEGFNRYSKHSENLFQTGLITAKDVTLDKFYEMYKNYAKNLLYDDDLIRTMDPLPSFPWAEAACGCPIVFTGKNIWSQKIGFEKTKEYLDSIQINNNPWIEKYGEFIKYLASEFPEYAIGQSILRGPLDLLCAMVGDGDTIYNLYDEPEFTRNALSKLSDIFNEFIRTQVQYTPQYYGGYSVGQYFMWTPGTVCRIQDDAMALITPNHYDEYVYEADVKISSVTEYSLYHTHATGLFIMDKIVRNKNLSIIQVNKDVGDTKVSDLIEGIKTIQNAGISVLIKGAFDKEDIDLLRKQIDKRGLAISCVVNNTKEADELKEYLMNLKW